MIFLLGACGLAVDLCGLYVARSEAQRAADAAALAGATVFVTSGCTYANSGYCTGAATAATNAAIAAGNQNLIAGQSPNIQTADVSFTALASVNPRINVAARRTVPTFFMKIFGVLSSNVSASATAEAYNPSDSTGGPTVCESCMKPFVVPNCDPNPNYTTPANSLCPGPGTQTYFFDPTTGNIQHPGTYPSGAMGESWVLHYSGAPSQYYELDLDASPPSCTSGSGGAGYGQNIRTCYKGAFGCGQQLCLLTGSKTGPTIAPVQDLIHASGNGLGQGQDTIDTSTGPPFTIRAGSQNPLVLSGQIAVGTPISSSSSVVTLPVYDGSQLCPGGSCGQTVTIKGYLQAFIQAVDHQGTDVPVSIIIMNQIGCGGVTGSCGSSGGGGGAVSGGGSAIPVRLVQP
jgi:hypothetical protein